MPDFWTNPIPCQSRHYRWMTKGQSRVLQQPQGYALLDEGKGLLLKIRWLNDQVQGLRLLDKADKLCPLHYWGATTDSIQTVRLK
jgi:hypothetical protein